MKALTVWQPWASLLVTRSSPGSNIAHKEYETRGWATKYQGTLAIHAAARKMDVYDLGDPGLRAAMVACGPDAFPYGCVVGIVDLLDCVPVNRLGAISEKEMCLGDYSPGRFAWKLWILHTFVTPVPYKGAQGLWNVPDSIVELAE